MFLEYYVFVAGSAFYAIFAKLYVEGNRDLGQANGIRCKYNSYVSYAKKPLLRYLTWLQFYRDLKIVRENGVCLLRPVVKG